MENICFVSGVDQKRKLYIVCFQADGDPADLPTAAE